MKVAVTGASGLVGSALVPFLTAGGHEVVRLVRRPPRGEGEIHWDPAGGEIDGAALEGVDAVVHLSGRTSPAGAGPGPARRGFGTAGSGPRSCSPERWPR